MPTAPAAHQRGHHPARAWITTAQTQTYIVTATDPLGNAWAANPAPGEWDLDGVAGAFDGACLHPSFRRRWARALLGQRRRRQLAELMVTEITGPGPFVVWDKGTFAFYLCAAPMYPQTGLPFAGSGSYDTGGRVVDAAVARRSSTDVTVSVSVVWYLRGNRLLKSYSYTSIDGAAPSTWTYASDNTFAPTGTQTGFRWTLVGSRRPARSSIQHRRNRPRLSPIPPGGMSGEGRARQAVVTAAAALGRGRHAARCLASVVSSVPAALAHRRLYKSTPHHRGHLAHRLPIYLPSSAPNRPQPGDSAAGTDYESSSAGNVSWVANTNAVRAWWRLYIRQEDMHMRRGFTLIELLVVIAIIAILAAILFPVFA